MKNLLLILVLILVVNLSAQTECPMQIGTNLPPADEQVFKDLKLSSTHFFTTNVVYLAGDSNYWDTELIDIIPTDLNGYPTGDVPFSHSSVDTTQIYHFITGTSGIYPTGHYILLFDGTGVLRISDWSDAENITQTSANRIEFDITTTSTNGIHIEILESIASNHVRNIRIVHEDDFSSYENQPFRDEFMDLTANFSCIRFMDWMATNKLYYDGVSPYDPATISWGDRVHNTYHRTNREEEGMAYEYPIRLANLLEKDIWVNIPHQADSMYIRNMAELFYNTVNPEVTIYVEFSNEVWNGIFQQTEFVEMEGPFPGEIGRNLGWFANRTFSIWEDVFGTDRDRLQLVLAGHDWICVNALGEMDVLPDVASYPGYFNMSETQWNELEAMGASVTVNDIVSRARTNMIAEDFYWMGEFKELVCDAYDLDFVMYEGGQHLLRLFGVEETFQSAIYETQISPEMFDLYTELLSFCRDSLEVTLFNHFTLFGPNENLFGSWGTVESVYETPNTSKFNALMNFSCESEDSINVSIQQINSIESSIYPNPTMDIINIELEKNREGYIEVVDVNGRRIKTQTINDPITQIDLSTCSNGIYFVKIVSNKNIQIEQIIKH